MHFVSKFTLGLLALPLISARALVQRDDQAAPSELDFEAIRLYAQYAAAAYCFDNFNPRAVNDKVRCKTGNCDLVQNATTTITSAMPPTGLSGSTGFVAVDVTNKLIVVAFRGSETLANFVVADAFSAFQGDVNANIPDANGRFPGNVCPAGCLAGRGFLLSWTDVRLSILAAVNLAVNNPANSGFKIVTTGHSLGAATATIAALELRKLYPGLQVDIGGIASPRVGNTILANFISSQEVTQGRNFRVAHNLDFVPNLPPVARRNPAFVHINPVYVINSPTGQNVTINDINRVDNNSAIVNNEGATFAIRLAAHTWYFNNISLCNTVPGSRIASPFATEEEEVRYRATFNF